MHDFACTQKLQRFADIMVIDQTEQIIVGDACFLFCRHIFMQVRENIAFYADIFHVSRDTGCSLRKNASGMVDKVGVKTGFFNVIFAETTGQLMQNASDHFQMCQFFCTDICQYSCNFTMRHAEPLVQIAHRSSKLSIWSAKLRNDDPGCCRVRRFYFYRELKSFFVNPHIS